MGLLTRDQALKSVEGQFTSGISPEISLNEMQTDFTENTTREEAGAAFRIENPPTSTIVDETNGIDNTPDPDFDFIGEIKGTEYEQDADYFVEALNGKYMDALKLRYHREQKDSEILARGGWSAMGWQFLAAILSPENLIPGTLAARGAKAGFSAAKSARNVGASGFAATSISEIGLHQSQGLRTFEESLLAVGVGTAFSAMFGAGLATISNRGIKSNWAQVFDQAFKQSDDFKIKYDKASPEDRVLLLQEAKTLAKEYRLAEVQEMSKLSDELKVRFTDDALDNQLDELYLEAQRVRRQHSLSAAIDVPTLDDLSLFGKAAGAYAKGTKLFNPILRSLHSPSPHARRVAANLFENPMLMKMNDFRDSPAALETRIKNWTEGRLADVITRMGTSGGKGVYTDMRKAGIHMSRDEFRKEVARAMRRNDGNVMTADGVDTGQPSGQFNEFVVKAAKIARKDLFEHARQELNKVGFELESKKSSTADSYLTRMWNQKKLNAGEQRFKARDGHVWNYIKRAIDHEIANATHKFENRIDNLAREIDELKREKLRRQSQLEEMPQKTLKGEYKRLLELDERIGQLETELRARPDMPQELGEALKEVAERILPSQVRLEIADQIEAATGVRFSFADDAVEPELQNLIEDANRILPGDTKFELVDQIDGAYGSFERNIPLIRVAKDAPDIGSTLRHEGLHALRSRFKSSEWKALVEASRKIDFENEAAYVKRVNEQFDVDDRAGKTAALDELNEERVANLIEYAYKGGDISSLEPKPRSMIEKIVAWIKALATTLKKPEYNNLQTILDQFESGSIAQRTPRKNIPYSKEALYQIGDKPLKTDTPEFKKWFGDSKVVDDDKGEPLVVYHGTGRGAKQEGKKIDFEEFMPQAGGENSGDGYGMKGTVEGVFFTDNIDLANKYSFDNGAVYPVYLSLKNPANNEQVDKLLDDTLHDLLEGKLSAADNTKTLKEQGFDGYIYEWWNGHKEYVVFDPTQIKSINNKGTFDPNDPRILYQFGDDTPRAKSTSDSLTGTHIEAPQELFDWLKIKPGKFQANYKKIAQKRAEQAPYDALANPTSMREHVENVLSNAAFALRHHEGRWNLISLDGQGKLLSVDIEVKGNQYNVITGHKMGRAQIEDKIRGAFESHGEEGFKWKVDPRRSVRGVPQEEFVNLSGVKDPLSTEEYINHVRQLQAYQERSAHPSAFTKDADGNIQGSFDGVEDLIQIARSALDSEATLRHEAVHALRSLKLFKDEEWALLEQSAKEFDWIGKHNIASRYDGVFDGDDAASQQGMLEEAIAEEFSKWRAGELEVTPEVKTIFERIQDALKRIAEVLRANGIESYEDVFKLVDEGEVAGRAKAQKQDELARLENEVAAIKGNIEKLEQGSLVPPEITPGELQKMIDLVGNGKRPKKPESLFQFLQKQGGMLDEDKTLLNLGLSPKTHPELVRAASDAINEPTYSLADKLNKGQPLSLEDAGFLAWNEGFFPDRPTTKAFLKALREELQGEESVRFKDLKQQRKHQDFVAVEEELGRLGINPKDPNVRFARTPFEEDIVSATARVLDGKADEQIAKLEQKIAETKIEHDQDMFPLELDLNGHVDEVVNGLFKKLTGRGNVEDFVNDNIIDYGFLKGRTFGIRDELIEEFLEDDIEHIMRRYTRNVAGQIEMKKRFGNLHLKNHFEAISDEFNGLRQEVHYSDKSPKQKQKEISKLEKQEADAIRDLQFARDKVLGRYEQDLYSSGWARTVDAALSWQYMTSLGGVLVTSLSDAWRTPMVQGFGHVFGKQLPALIAGNKGVKINRDLARKYAGIAEIINNSRLAHMAGLNDPFSVSTPAEIAIQKMTDRFSKLTGLPYWNQFWKEFVGTVIIDRALGNMIKGIDNISAQEVRWLRSLGLGDMATGAKQLQAEGAIEKVQGIWTINPDKMPGPLMDLFFAGVKKEIDTTIVSKGIGDAPLFAETKLGRIATQFKSFGAASNQRMLIRGMQDDLGNFTAGMAGMITTGMFIYMLKQLEAGREIDDNPGTWLAEGIDRSGMFFLFFEANNIVEKIGGPGVYQALDAKAPASRFASRNAVGALAGPLFGSATDLFTVLGQGARAINPGAEVDLSPGDVNATRRLAPYATLPYWRWLVDGYIVPTMQDEVR